MIKLSVCIGSSCHIKGSYNVIQVFQQLTEENCLHGKIELKAAFCMKQCQKSGVSVAVNGKSYGVEPENARKFFRETVLPLID